LLCRAGAPAAAVVRIRGRGGLPRWPRFPDRPPPAPPSEPARCASRLRVAYRRKLVQPWPATLRTPRVQDRESGLRVRLRCSDRRVPLRARRGERRRCLGALPADVAPTRRHTHLVSRLTDLCSYQTKKLISSHLAPGRVLV